MRIERLAALLPAGTDAAMLVSAENRRYFTGFAASDGCLIVSRRGAVLFADGRYFEAASKHVTQCEVRGSRDFTAQVSELFSDWGVGSVAVEAERLTLARLAQYQARFSQTEFVTDGELDKIVAAMRAVKDAQELCSIEAAQAVAEGAFARILNAIAPGRTEREIALELDYAMLRHGAEALSFETIAVGGPNSSLPHGVPTDRPLLRGDFLTLDFGAVCGGYHSDMTRTVAVGSVSDAQKEVYALVLRAQEACLAGLRAGMSGIEADALARGVIEAAGYGAYFSHGTGHGVGIEIHEGPNLSANAAAVLAAGNVVTVEPGIYLPGRFGVRIEDMAHITAEGCRNLTRAPKELLVV